MRATIPLVLAGLNLCAPSQLAHASEGGEALFAKDNLVAWCIVPFDAAGRGPEARAQMLSRLGVTKVAYDWRDEHVASFEAEILAYRKYGLEYFAFWSWHPAMAPLIEKHGIRPQIWETAPSPKAANSAEKVEAAGRELLPLVEQAGRMGCKVGLYNHGGWGGEPRNLVAVCRWLRDHAEAEHVGIVYNLHHGHDHIEDFAESLRLMSPYLLCLNLNGMNEGAHPKILPLGKGEHEKMMLEIITNSDYRGPIGILDHRPEIDAEQSLRENLGGLKTLLKELGYSEALGTY